MGNMNSNLGIQIDQDAVYSGGVISGKVFLQVTSETEAATLQIMFVGKEHSHVHWTTTHTSGSGKNRRTTTRHHHAYRDRTLVAIDVPLGTFPEGVVRPGNYEFPFSTTLPAGLPSVMAASGGGGDCRVTYTLKARLHKPSWYKWDTTATRSIMVQSAPLPPSPVPYFAPPTSVPVTCCWGCGAGGLIHMGAGVDDTLLGRGQSVGVGIAVANESREPIENVGCKITEHVRWWAGGHSNSSYRVVAMTNWDMTQMQGLAELSKDTMKEKEWASSPEAGNAARLKTLEALAATLMSGQQRSLLTVAPDARDSYCGSILSCTHRMFVTSKTRCCVTDPELQVPVQIGTLPLPEVVQGAAVVALPVPEPIPMAEAIPTDKDEQRTATALPADWTGVVVAGTVVLPMGEAVVGGAATDGGEDDGAPLVMATVVASAHAEGTMESLKEKMDADFNDLTLLERLLTEGAATWGQLLSNLSPAYFATIVGDCNIEFDQPKVAELLGKQLQGGVTAAHIIEANKKAAPNQPPNIIIKLAPLCVDLQENVAAIEAGLSDWDKILSKSALRPRVSLRRSGSHRV